MELYIHCTTCDYGRVLKERESLNIRRRRRRRRRRRMVSRSAMLIMLEA
jgi:hypothetical protein